MQEGPRTATIILPTNNINITRIIWKDSIIRDLETLQVQIDIAYNKEWEKFIVLYKWSLGLYMMMMNIFDVIIL